MGAGRNDLARGAAHRQSGPQRLDLPRNLGPVVVAAGLQINNWDTDIARWAGKNTPLFGSQKNASVASDFLLYSSIGTYAITAFATPSGEDPQEWLDSKLRGIFFGATAAGLTYGTTTALKETTGRRRPDRSDRRSLSGC